VDRRQRLSYSVGFTLPDSIVAQLAKVPEREWQPAYDAHGEPRDGAWVLDSRSPGWSTCPAGRPACGRSSVRSAHTRARSCACPTPAGSGSPRSPPTPHPADRTASPPTSNLQHRRRAHAEEWIRCAKDTGLTNLPPARAGPEPHLVRQRRAGLRIHRLGPAAPLHQQTRAAANPSDYGCGCSPSRAARPHRTAHRAAPTPPGTLGRASSCKRSPTCRHALRLADTQPHPAPTTPDPGRGTGAHPSDLGRTVLPTRQNHAPTTAVARSRSSLATTKDLG
jgi:hypothetical protein